MLGWSSTGKRFCRHRFQGKYVVTQKTFLMVIRIWEGFISGSRGPESVTHVLLMCFAEAKCFLGTTPSCVLIFTWALWFCTANTCATYTKENRNRVHEANHVNNEQCGRPYPLHFMVARVGARTSNWLWSLLHCGIVCACSARRYIYYKSECVHLLMLLVGTKRRRPVAFITSSLNCSALLG